jgi:hypothetical protein
VLLREFSVVSFVVILIDQVTGLIFFENLLDGLVVEARGKVAS